MVVGWRIGWDVIEHCTFCLHCPTKQFFLNLTCFLMYLVVWTGYVRIYWQCQAWRSCMFVCRAEWCMICYAIYFETRSACLSRRGSTYFRFTMFFITLCRVRMTSVDPNMYSCSCGLVRYDYVGSMERGTASGIFSAFRGNIFLSHMCTAFAIFLSFYLRKFYSFRRHSGHAKIFPFQLY